MRRSGHAGGAERPISSIPGWVTKSSCSTCWAWELKKYTRSRSSCPVSDLCAAASDFCRRLLRASTRCYYKQACSRCRRRGLGRKCNAFRPVNETILSSAAALKIDRRASRQLLTPVQQVSDFWSVEQTAAEQAAEVASLAILVSAASNSSAWRARSAHSAQWGPSCQSRGALSMSIACARIVDDRTIVQFIVQVWLCPVLPRNLSRSLCVHMCCFC